jgi:FkbM family methyltransferase
MINNAENHRRIMIDTGYQYYGRDDKSYVYTGFVDKFMDKIHGMGWSPKVYLDIGSRDLMQTIEVAQYHPETRFIAFEPVPWQYQVCYDRSLEWDNIEVYNFAISEEEGYADFWELEQNTGGSSLLEPIDVPGSNNKFNKIKVQCKRLDNILKFLNIEKVDCLWIDTQGTELNVLKSLGSYLNEVMFIHTEASPKPYYKNHILKNKIDNFLIENGFDLEFHPCPNHPYGEGDIIATRTKDIENLTKNNSEEN